jgi:hypothetical protein
MSDKCLACVARGAAGGARPGSCRVCALGYEVGSDGLCQAVLHPYVQWRDRACADFHVLSIILPLLDLL